MNLDTIGMQQPSTFKLVLLGVCSKYVFVLAAYFALACDRL